MAKIWPQTTPSAGKDVVQQELSHIVDGMQNGAATSGDGGFPIELNMLLPCSPTIVLPSIHPK